MDLCGTKRCGSYDKSYTNNCKDKRYSHIKECTNSIYELDERQIKGLDNLIEDDIDSRRMTEEQIKEKFNLDKESIDEIKVDIKGIKDKNFLESNIVIPLDQYLKGDISTQDKISILFTNFEEFLKEKNRKYGDSALKPMNIFSKTDSSEQILNRIDDKLSRIKNSNKLRKNDVSDIFGYLALLMINNDWLEFGEMID